MVWRGGDVRAARRRCRRIADGRSGVAAVRGTSLRRRGDRHRCIHSDRVFPTDVSATVVVRRAARHGLSDIGVEGQPADFRGQRRNALRGSRRRDHVAAATRPAARHARRGGRCVDAVHIQGQAALPAVSHGVQRGHAGDDRRGHRSGLQPAWRTAGPLRLLHPVRAARRGHGDVLLRQHRPHRRRDCVVHGATVRDGVAPRFSVERRELHGRQQRRRRGRGGHRTWLPVDRVADAGSRVPDVLDLQAVRQAPRGPDTARR